MPFGLGQNAGKLRETAQDAVAARHATRDLKDAQTDLVVRVERLEALTRALYGYLRDQHHLSPEELQVRMRMEREEATASNQVTIHDCPRCRRKVNNRTRRCVFCGEENPYFMTI